MLIVVIIGTGVAMPLKVDANSMHFSQTSTALHFVGKGKEPICPSQEKEVSLLGRRLITGFVLDQAASWAGSMWPAPSVTERVNILLVGSDTRSGDNYGHSDMLMLVTVDPEAKTAALLSIPRDLWVSIPGHGENRINQAYRFGEISHYPGGGPALLKETVAANLGAPVHRYILVKFEGFMQLVDALGGVEICIPETLDVPKYLGHSAQSSNKETFSSLMPEIPEDSTASDAVIQAKTPSYLYIEAGTHTLDAQTALRYVRGRDTISGDFARVQRQQALLLAMRSKALKLDVVPRIPQLWRALRHTFETDLELGEVIQLARLAVDIPGQAIQPYAINHNHTIDYRTDSGARVLLPQTEAITTLIRQIFDPF